MGLFTRKNKKVAWRAKDGTIVCPGDSCPQKCDDTCPIYFNTQALMLMQIGHADKAIPLFEDALKLAPDFYDVWNNLGAIYGQMGNYQKAYDSYAKARECNTMKPNPVYGLMLTSRDLGKYEECLSWCETYKTLSKDGAEVPIMNEVNNRLGKAPHQDVTDRY